MEPYERDYHDDTSDFDDRLDIDDVSERMDYEESEERIDDDSYYRHLEEY